MPPKDDDTPKPLDPRELVTMLGAAQAPIIFADLVSMFGASSLGVTGFTLEAYRSMALPSGPHNDRVAVAHIRLTDEAMRSLRNALQQIDARPAEGAAPTNTDKAHTH